MSSLTDSGRFRLTPLLVVTTIGVYLLVVLGATTALTNATAACGSWPVCSVGVLADPGLAVAFGHRIVAAAVGVLTLFATVLAWRNDTRRRVRGSLTAALALYPIQVLLGALVATTSLSWVPTVHLLVGVAIFLSLIGALAWRLEARTPTGATDAGERSATEPAASSESSEDTTESPGAPTPAGVRPTGLSRIRVVVAAYFDLMKPRLMWLLCLVAAAGMVLAAGPELQVTTVLGTLGGGVLAIGASGTFNHVLERDVDREMARTADRPLATHQVPVRNATVFGVALAAASLLAFSTVNLLVVALGAFAISFYTVIYTLVLKPNTAMSTSIGGAAGALPALIGWVAVTGRFGVPGLALAGLIFLWTPAHFYNLALAYQDDYERGGFPMLPVVRGKSLTRKHILWYLAATLVAASVLATVSDLGWLYAAATVLVGGLFLVMVVRLHRERTQKAALRAFHASNAFLGAVLVSIVIEGLLL